MSERSFEGPHARVRPVVGLAITLALHALVIALAFTRLGSITDRAETRAREQQVTVLYLRPPEPDPSAPEPDPVVAVAEAPAMPPPVVPLPEVASVVEPVTRRQPASRAAPAPPTAEEWAFASTYKLKNSKGYRHTWGQQVRSMMGTAVEGPDQGMVRFRIEIAPDGSLTRLDTLWSTSAVAERLARQAVSSMPRWPSTPTGQPLIFEKTISFSPFASDDPPALQGRLPARSAGVQQPFCLGRQVSPLAGAGQADREAGSPGAGGLPQAIAEGLHRGRERTRPATAGAVGLRQTRALSFLESSYCPSQPLLRA